MEEIMMKRIEEAAEIVDLPVDVLKITVFSAIGFFRSEGETDEEILERVTVDEILGMFVSCPKCGSYKGDIRTMTMSEEFDPCPAEVFICRECKETKQVN